MTGPADAFPEGSRAGPLRPEPETRAAILAESRAWLGTPYHHRAKLKGVGVDCAQFPLAVYSACGLFEDFDTGDYPPDWHMHRSAERYLGVAQRLARREIPQAEAKPGDFLIFRIGRCFAHGAIIVDYPAIIHAVVRHRVTEDDAEKGFMAGRERRLFSFW